MSNESKTTDWVSIIINVFFALISVVFGISSCHYSKQANDFSQKANDYSKEANSYYEKQANAALAEHDPYIAIISHFDDGGKKHGIFIHNYSSGLAIVDEINISGQTNQTLTFEKWKNILLNNGFHENEILCFSFTYPQKDIGLSGNSTVPLVFFSSEIEKLISENERNNICYNTELIKKLENIPIEIKYKSRLPNSSIQTAKIFRLYSEQP